MTSRRIAVASALLALSGTAIACATELPVGGTFGLDAELVELNRQLAAEWARTDEWGATASHDITDEEIAAVMAPGGLLVERIEQMQAHTYEGLLVKAQAISWCNSGEEIDPDQFCPHPGATTDAGSRLPSCAQDAPSQTPKLDCQIVVPLVRVIDRRSRHATTSASDARHLSIQNKRRQQL